MICSAGKVQLYSHRRIYDIEMSLFIVLCDEVAPVVKVPVLNIGSIQLPEQRIVESLALKYCSNIVSYKSFNLKRVFIPFAKLQLKT